MGGQGAEKKGTAGPGVKNRGKKGSSWYTRFNNHYTYQHETRKPGPELNSGPTRERSRLKDALQEKLYPKNYAF